MSPAVRMAAPGPGSPAGRDRDAAAVAAARRGDEEAFADLLDRHHPVALRLARCYLESRPAAEELARQAWAEVLRTLDRWDGFLPFRAWLLGMVACLARFGGASLHADTAGAACGPARPAGGRWDQGRQDSAEAADRARAAVDLLPPLERAVLTVRDVAGCDAATACALLGLSRAEQAGLLGGARRKLRDAVAPFMREGPAL